MSMENLKTGVMALVLIALIAGAGALALDAFSEDLPTKCPDGGGGTSWVWNASDANCHNTTINNSTTSGANTAYNTTIEGLQGVGNATSYLSTIGVMIGIAALIAVVVGAFYFIGRR